MTGVQFILYVTDQQAGTVFYWELLQTEPLLNVPGMTEFSLSGSAKLWLMPVNVIANILGDTVPHPALGKCIPRCELYLKINGANDYLKRAVALGGREISTLQERDWGDKAGYVADPDGYIIAFAEK